MKSANNSAQTQGGKVLFLIKSDALIVANSGAQFTRLGVIGLCMMNLGEKQNEAYRPDDNYKNVSDSKLVGEIAKRTEGEYKNSNLRKEHARHEKETDKDYNGRFVWELLQNADDAAGADCSWKDLIGAKGLGFKSVLEISDEPAIYSGAFRFHFSGSETRHRLKLDDETPVPAFRIPHEKSEEQRREVWGQLTADDFTTAIRLPFRDDNARGTAIEKLKGLKASCLLFCQTISQIEIAGDGVCGRILKIDPPGFVKGATTVTLTKTRNGQTNSKKWRRWVKMPQTKSEGKRLSVAVCLPMEDGKITALGKPEKLHVFFPTEEEIVGAKALIHASLDLESNRKHFAEKQDNQLAIGGGLGELTAEILNEIPAAAALRAFGEVESTNDEGARAALQNAIAKAVSDTPFVPVIGGGKVKPADVRLWNYGIGGVLREDCAEVREEVREEKLLCPFLNSEDGIGSILERLGAQKIECHKEHADLLRYCKRGSSADCLAAWEIADKLVTMHSGEERDAVIKRLKNAPLWWTDKQAARASEIKGGYPPLKKRPSAWPQFLKAESLDGEFAAKIDKGKKDGINCLLLQDPDDYFNRALLPYCENNAGSDNASAREWWRARGAEILRWVGEWCESCDSPLIIGKTDNKSDKKRNRAGALIHLPTDKGWLPAIDCYAGKEWGGPSSFDDYFKDIADCGVVLAIDNDKWPSEVRDGKDKNWRGIFRWLGVAWEPKTLTCGTVDYKLKHFPESINGYKPEDIPVLFSRIRKIWELPKIPQSGPRGGYCPPRESHAHQQIRSKSWLPSTEALLGGYAAHQMPDNAFMPDCKLSGEFIPKVIRPGTCLDDEWGQIYDWLGQLGVHKEIPENTNRDWWRNAMSQLRTAVVQENKEIDELRCDHKKGKLAQVTFALYDKFDHALINMGEIPFVHKTPKGEIVDFAPFDEVFWADKSYFEDGTVRRALLDGGFKFFIFLLNEGKNFGLTPLSSKIKENANPGLEQGTVELRERFQERYKMLELVPGATASGILSAKQIKGVASLSLLLCDGDGKEIAKVEIEFWHENDTLLVNTHGNKWSALGSGLAAAWNKKSLWSNFRILLSAEKAECRKILRDRHNISDAALEENRPVLESTQSENSGNGVAPLISRSESDDSPNGGKRAARENFPQPPVRGETSGASSQPENIQPITPPDRPKERGDEARQAGEAAEVWLEERLKNCLPEYCVYKAHKGRDFEIAQNDEVCCQIEVKHTDSGEIQWSQAQINAAKKTRDGGEKYYVAVLRRTKNNAGEADHQVFWFFNPLAELCVAGRKLHREWKESVDMPANDGWNIPNQSPTDMPLKTCKVAIPVGDLLSEPRKDDGDLSLLKKRLAGAAD